MRDFFIIIRKQVEGREMGMLKTVPENQGNVKFIDVSGSIKEWYWEKVRKAFILLFSSPLQGHRWSQPP